MRYARLNPYLLFRLSPLALCIAAICALANPALASTAHAKLKSIDEAPAAVEKYATDLAGPLTLRASHAASAAPVSPLRRGSTIRVTRCDDDTRAGSLRRAALTAHSGDTIDLSGLACSTITLNLGAIAVGVDDLIVQGPRAGDLTIDGNQTDRVFTHNGHGTLELRDLHVSRGRFEADAAYGGCIHSIGSVSLTRSTVNLCAAVGHNKAAGGGVVALQDLTMQSSEISANVASVTGGQHAALVAAAGGALVHGHLTLRDSALSGNTVLAARGRAYGGAAVIAEITAKRSTVSGNQSVAIDGVTDDSNAGRMAATASVFLIDTSATSVASALLDGRVGALPNGTPAADAARASGLAIGGILTIADLDTLASVR